MTRSARVVLLAIAAGLLVASSACPSLDPFTCLDDDQCTLMAEGTCHANEGACSYPDDECTSGRRWSQTAGALAETCVADSLAECGNGVVEGDEECDEPDAPSCDACTSDCRLAGQVRWSATHDGMGFDDFFDSVVVDPSGGVIAVGRAGTGTGDLDQDRLVVRYDPNGQVSWTMEESSPGRDDLNCVVLGPSGEVIAGGVRQSAEGNDEIWVGRYDEGIAETLLAYGALETRDTVGHDCAFTTDGRLVVSGMIDGGGEAFEKWDRLVLDDALGPDPEQLLIGGSMPLAGTRDIAYEVAAGPDGDVLAAGNVTKDVESASERWIARFDAAGTWQGEYVDGGAGQGQEEVLALVVGDELVYAVGSTVFNAGGTERTWVAALTYDGLAFEWDNALPLDPSSAIKDIALDVDGGLLVVADMADTTAVLAKLDPADGACQWMVTAPAGARDLGRIVVAPDGSLVIAGGIPAGDHQDALVATLWP